MEEINGYNLNQEDYENLLLRLYGFEEYYYYNNNKHYKDYISVLNDLDKIKNFSKEYQNALYGWFLFFKYEKRWLNYKHSCFRITDLCQLNCKHCYNRNAKRTNRIMTYDEFIFLYHRLHEIGKKFVHADYHDRKLDYHFEGGEAVLNPHLLKMLQFLNKQNISTIVLSNGYDFPDEIIEYFKLYPNLNKVQVSIDGFESSHNFMRGENSYQRVLHTLQKLKNNNIKFNCNMVIHNDNVDEFFLLENFIRQNYDTDTGAMIYNNQNVSELSSLNEKDLIKILEWKEKYQKITCQNRCECLAGHQTVIKEDGNLRFCSVGFNNNITNLYTDSIEESLFKIKLNTIRYRSIPVYCFDCEKVSFCKGGEMCSTHKLDGILNKEDIKCHKLNWKVQKEGMLEQILSNNIS